MSSCRAALDVLPPGSAFSHITSAALLGLPLSTSMEADERPHVIRPIAYSQTRISGFCGHRALHPRELVVVAGLPVVGLADTWVDLGELIGRGKPVGLDDAIVVGDACATKLGSRKPLRMALARRVRPRGKVTLLEALDYVRVGAVSPRETIARLVLVRAGLPEPKLNEPVMASWDEDLLLGVADLLWDLEAPDGTRRRVIGEYQGEAYHSSKAQRRFDEARGAGFRADGWCVEEIWKRHLESTEARRDTVLRFAKALGVAGEQLSLCDVDARFFSSHAIDEAIQRAMRRAARPSRL